MLTALRVGIWLLSFPVLTGTTHILLMQTTDPASAGLSYAIAAGVPGVLGFLVLGFINEWLVPGRSYRRERARGDRLEATLYKAVGVTKVVVEKALSDGDDDA